MLLCTDPILEEILEKKGIKAIAFDQVLSPAQKQSVLEDLYDFAKSWFWDTDGKDFTLYRGVSIGAAIMDEVMILFQIFAHWSTLIESLDGQIQSVYQSTSCLLPMVVQKLLQSKNIAIETIDAKYPYVCYELAWERNASRNYACINFSQVKKNDACKKRKSISACWHLILLFFFRLMWVGKKFYFVQVMRNLRISFSCSLKKRKRAYGVLLAENGRMLPGDGTLEGLGYWKTLRALARKGFFIWTLNNRGKEDRQTAVREFVDGVLAGLEHIAAPSQDWSEENRNLFNVFFSDVISRAMPSACERVDALYAGLDQKKIKGGIMELAHPLLLQVAANLGKTVYLNPLNSLIHNQYFSTYSAAKCEPALKVVSFSDYDKNRYTQMGISERSINMNSNVVSLNAPKLRPFVPCESVAGASVLVIPNFAPALFTYRFQLSGPTLVTYLSDVFEALGACGVKKATIRNHPGMEGYTVNSHGVTFQEMNEYLISNAIDGHESLAVEIDDAERMSLEESVAHVDFVVGIVSGSIFEVLTLGKNYIVYDKTVSPYPDIFGCSLVQDGFIEVNRTKQEFQKALLKNIPVARDKIVHNCFPFLENQQRYSSRGLIADVIDEQVVPASGEKR